MVRKLLVEAGSVVPVGDPIAVVGSADEKIDEAPTKVVEPNAEKKTDEQGGEEVKTEPGEARKQQAEPSPEGKPAPAAQPTPVPAPPTQAAAPAQQGPHPPHQRARLVGVEVSDGAPQEGDEHRGGEVARQLQRAADVDQA